eukprot:PITA_34705
MDEELDQIEKNDTWELVPRPHYKNLIGTKWIFKKKLNENGEVIRNKENLVCKWYAQQEGIEFEETFAPVARLEAIKMFLTLSSFRKFKVYQMDVKSALLNGYLEEEVYVEQPKGLIPGNDAKLQEFEMSLLAELTYFLVLQVQQTKDGIFLSQTKYLKNILKKYEMEYSKPVCTPIVTGCSLRSNDDSLAVNQPEYRSMIGSLLYLIGTRPDIMHVVGIVGRFQANPEESHLQVVKRIFKYIQGTQDFSLWYPKDTDITHHAYTDVNWAGNVDDRKRISGGACYMGSQLVSWFNKKESSIALSTLEAEYVVVASCCTQLLWMMQTLQDIQIKCSPPISILCDNTSAISISKNHVLHSKTKHIPIKYHFLREKMLEQKVK